MRIPLLDLNAQHAPLREQILRAITEVLDSGTFILGPAVKALESRMGEYCKTKHAIAASSGTDALLVSLMALGIGPGDEVITTVYSFFATAGVIARVGARPVFVDIDPKTYNIDAQHIARAITRRTKAIIPVHLFGQCADMEAILDLANKNGLSVIEDAAQAIGGECRNGHRIGGLGTIGCLSFFPSKNLGAIGDGGMVLTNDSQLAETIRLLRSHGAQPKYFHRMIGGNFRLDEIQAAVVNVKLSRLDEWTEKRQENADRYAELFVNSSIGDRIRLPMPADRRYRRNHVYNQFVIRTLDRDNLREFLALKGISTEIYYPLPFHRQYCFRHLNHGETDFPEANMAALETLALPVYPELTGEQQRIIVQTMEEFYMKKPS